MTRRDRHSHYVFMSMLKIVNWSTCRGTSNTSPPQLSSTTASREIESHWPPHVFAETYWYIFVFSNEFWLRNIILIKHFYSSIELPSANKAVLCIQTKLYNLFQMMYRLRVEIILPLQTYNSYKNFGKLPANNIYCYDDECYLQAQGTCLTLWSPWRVRTRTWDRLLEISMVIKLYLVRILLWH